MLDPKYYLKKSTGAEEQNKTNFELAQLNSVCVDFDKTLKNFKEKGPEVQKGPVNQTPYSRASKTSQSNVQQQQETYTERARREKQLSNETKFYYAVWRTAFSQALEKLRESKVLYFHITSSMF